MTIRDNINTILGDRQFTLVSEKEGFDIYASKDLTMFSNGEQLFILLFVRRSLSAPMSVQASEVLWHNVQFRTFNSKDLELTFLSIKGRKFHPPDRKLNLDVPLQLVSRMDMKTIFALPENMGTVSILHGLDDTKKPSTNLTLIRAILSWRCSIDLTDLRQHSEHIFL